MTMIGREGLGIKHTRQPYDQPRGPISNKNQRRVQEENKLGRQIPTTDHACGENTPTIQQPHLPKQQLAALQIQPRDTALLERNNGPRDCGPRQPVHVQPSASSITTEGTLDLLSRHKEAWNLRAADDRVAQL